LLFMFFFIERYLHMGNYVVSYNCTKYINTVNTNNTAYKLLVKGGAYGSSRF